MDSYRLIIGIGTRLQTLINFTNVSKRLIQYFIKMMNKGKTDEGRGVSWTGQLWQTRLHMAFLIANIQVVHNCQYSKLYLAILVAK